MYKHTRYKIRWYLRRAAAELLGMALAGVVCWWAAGDDFDPGNWKHMVAGFVAFGLVWNVTSNVLLQTWVYRHQHPMDPYGRHDQQ
ncbi:hypothetical protein ACIBEA_40425 [Streptomyces sp. NPDC051555]|uniref:hypothetical protein n=1 Tax=Streptomyces sp. NPDC051555 TaxID=3365657 RepID=UPI00379A62CF